MLSSAKITTASWQYYVRQEPCRAADYYLGHDQDAGVWLGRGLDKLGLELGAEVSERELEALFARAINPSTGQQLGRAWRADGVTGFDLTFSAPKSVSALLAAAGSPDAERGQDPPEAGGLGRELGGAGDVGSRTAIGSAAAEDVEVEQALSAARNVSLVGAVQRSQSSRQLLLWDVEERPGGRQGKPLPAGVPPGDGGGLRQAVTAAHDTATHTALDYLDRHASLSRRGTDGVEQVTSSGFTVAAFRHYTSREGDPQLHTHALVLNKVQCADGTWRSLDGHEMYAHKKSAGMIYQTVLRNELAATLGIQFEEVSKDGQAEILGIPERLLQNWSKRTVSVNAEAAAAIAALEAQHRRSLNRDERAAVTKTAVLKTRPDKSHEHPEALTTRWVAEARELGIDLAGLLPAAQRAASTARPGLLAIERQAQDLQRKALLTVDGLAHAALAAAGRSRAVFGRAEVAGHAAALLPTTGMPAAEVLARIEAVADRALELADAVAVGATVQGVTPRRSDPRYATREVLDAETRLLTLAETGQARGAGRVSYDQLRATLTTVRAGGVDLDRSQVEALLHLTTHGDQLNVLTAPAGAGKTATLGACAHAWHTAGYRVIGLAPSARAAAELAAAIRNPPEDGTSEGGRVDTLAKWLHTRALHPDLDQPALSPSAGPAGGPRRAAWARLDAQTVLVVDEASMASTLDLDVLTQAAARAGAKVVLVGDPAQIGVIDGPGGMLATLAHDGTNTTGAHSMGGSTPGYTVALTAIHRFSQEWEKQASLALRSGTRTALEPYLQQQRLHPSLDGDSAADAVFSHWQHARGQGVDALMLARTRIDVDALNLRARAAAHATDHAFDPSEVAPVDSVTTLGGRDWQTGDLLRTRKNNRQLALAADDAAPASDPGGAFVRNGDRYRVLGIAHATPHEGDRGAAGASVTGLLVEDLTGRGQVVLPTAYVAKHCEYGWAATIDGSQGATCDLGLLLVRPGLDREHLYVGMTRGRHANHAYIAPEPTAGPDQHTPTRPDRARDVRQLDSACLEVLQTALAVSGAQDSATHALRRDSAQGVPATTFEGRPPSDPAPASPRPWQAPPPPREPSPAEIRLTAVRNEREHLHDARATVRGERDVLYSRRRPLHDELTRLPRRAFARRHTLTSQISEIDVTRAALDEQLSHLDHTDETLISEERRLTRQLRTEPTSRATQQQTGTTQRPTPGAAGPAIPSTTASPERASADPRPSPRTNRRDDRLPHAEPDAGRDRGRALDR